MKSVVTFGCEVWTLKVNIKISINAVEIDYVRHSARTSMADGICNEEIQRRMSAQQTLIERIDQRP